MDYTMFCLYGIEHSTARLATLIKYIYMGRQIDPSWGEPIELFLVPASVPRMV